MRRIKVLVFTAIFIVLLSVSMQAFASGTSNIVLDTKTVKAGDTFDYCVSLSENTGVSNLGLIINFDSTVLTINSIGSSTVGNEFESKSFNKAYETGKAFATFINSSEDANNTTSGNLCKLNFTVASSAVKGNYPITVTVVKSLYLVGIDEKPATLTPTNGAANVIEPNTIYVSKAPKKVEYVEGQTFDPAGMEVTYVNDSGAETPVTTYTYTHKTALATTDTAITISYTPTGATDPLTTTQPIKVVPKAVESISAVLNLNGKTVYTSAALDALKDYLTVTATNNDASTSTVEKTDYTLSYATGKTALEAGDNTITVTHTSGKTTTFVVTVTASKITKIEAAFDQSGATIYTSAAVDSLKTLEKSAGVKRLSVTGIYNDKQDANAIGVTNDTTIDLANVTLSTSSGSLGVDTATVSVTVSYGAAPDTLTCTFDVAVTKVELASISAALNLNGKTVYTSAELDALKDYLTVTAVNNDASTSEVAKTDYTLSYATGKTALEAGDNTITVTHTSGKTTTFVVTVTASKITKIEAAFDQSGATIYTSAAVDSLKTLEKSAGVKRLSVTGIYNDKQDANAIGVTNDTTIDLANVTLSTSSGSLGVDTATVPVTVSYGASPDTVTTTFDVSVTKIDVASISAVLALGGRKVYTSAELDALKPYLTVTATYNDSSTSTVVAADYTLSYAVGKTALAEGANTVTVTYDGKSVPFDVGGVIASQLDSIAATFTQETATIYTSVGLEGLTTAKKADDSPRLVVTGGYNDTADDTGIGKTPAKTLVYGTDYTMTSDYAADPTGLGVESGVRKITAALKIDVNKTAEFNVTVTKVEIKSIEATFTQGDALFYTNDDLNDANILKGKTTLLSVIGKMNNGDSAGEVGAYTLDYVALKAGINKITVKYSDAITDDFDLTATQYVADKAELGEDKTVNVIRKPNDTTVLTDAVDITEAPGVGRHTTGLTYDKSDFFVGSDDKTAIDGLAIDAYAEGKLTLSVTNVVTATTAKVYYTNNETVKVLVGDISIRNAVAQIEANVTGETAKVLYASLADFISDLSADSKYSVTLLDDITVTNTLAIPEGAVIAIDLGGKSITSTVDPIFEINGTLSLKNGTLKGAVSKAAILNKSRKTLEINGVAIENSGYIQNVNGRAVVTGLTKYKIVLDTNSSVFVDAAATKPDIHKSATEPAINLGEEQASITTTGTGAGTEIFMDAQVAVTNAKKNDTIKLTAKTEITGGLTTDKTVNIDLSDVVPANIDGAIKGPATLQSSTTTGLEVAAAKAESEATVEFKATNDNDKVGSLTVLGNLTIDPNEVLWLEDDAILTMYGKLTGEVRGGKKEFIITRGEAANGKIELFAASDDKQVTDLWNTNVKYTVEISGDETVDLFVKATPDGSYSFSRWTGGDAIDSTGKFTVKDSGYVIGAEFTYNPPYDPTVTVTGVKLDKETATVDVGKTVTLTATVLPENASNKTVTWATSDAAVATVANGVVTGVAEGKATITVTTVDGAKTAKCEVTVAKTVEVTGVTLDMETASVETGKTVTLTATVLPENATNKKVTWATSDAAVATVADGVVTGVAEGKATITVTTEDGAKTAQCEVTVTKPGEPDEDVKLFMNIRSIAVKKSAALPTVPGAEGTWSVADETVASVTVSPKGVPTVNALKTGVTKLRFTVTKIVGKAEALDEKQPVVGKTYDLIELRVRKAGELTKNVKLNAKKVELDTKVNMAFTLTAKLKPAKKVVDPEVFWVSSNPNVAKVDANGNVIAVAPGTAKITAYSTNMKTAEAKVVVKGALTKLKIVDIDGKVIKKKKLIPVETVQLFVSINSDALNKSVVWETSDRSIATVDQNGFVTAVMKGTATITVTAQDGSGLKATCKIKVK